MGSTASTRKKVIVIGGGVGGLTAAHELIERGFEVEVYEKRRLLGGKARSIDKPSSGRGESAPGKPRLNLPGEHGFRFFPGFYQHVPDTMRRIEAKAERRPQKTRTVHANLVHTETVLITQTERPPFAAPIHLQSWDDWTRVAEAWRTRQNLGLRAADALVFAGLLLDLMCTSRERRTKEYDDLSWWDYVDADGRGPTYKKFCAIGLTRNLVAMKASEASTRTVGNILIQFVRDVFGGQADRVLCSPTNTAWIGPWTDLLRDKGVTFHSEHELVRFDFDTESKRITSVMVQSPLEGTKKVSGDYYVSALPVDVMTRLLFGTPIADASPSLRRAMQLKTDWMNGVQFYLEEDLDLNYGHQLHLDTKWSLTSISQCQFWERGAGDDDFGFDIGRHGDGNIRAILSVDISDWKTPGDLVRRPAEDCAPHDVVREVWAQLRSSFAHGEFTLKGEDPPLHYLDPDIVPIDGSDIDFDDPQVTLFNWSMVDREVVPSLRGTLSSIERMERLQAFEAAHGLVARVENQEPLLINTTGSLAWRPDAGTEIENLILASAYVKTNADLATMESANEAGRRAANAVLQRSGSIEKPARIYAFKEPLIFLPFRMLDWVLFKLGLPHIGVRSLLRLCGQIDRSRGADEVASP